MSDRSNASIVLSSAFDPSEMQLPLTYIVASLCVLTASVLATPATRTLPARMAINPDIAVLRARFNGTASPRPTLAPRTNAERLRRGLPLLVPARRRAADAARPARRSSLPPVTRQGNIIVIGSDGTPLGLLSEQMNDFGEFGYLASKPFQVICVAFTYDPDAPSVVVDLRVTDPITDPAGEGSMGGIVGIGSSSPDLGPRNPNYNPVGLVSHTPPSSPPVSGANSFSDITGTDTDIESAIWTFDPSTTALVPHWVNTDSSLPPTTLVYAPSEPMIALAGDVDAFRSATGETSAQLVTFVLAEGCQQSK
ncbi:hypothetical protein C8R47DRAFT_1216891 [Mycena vitilis]|nr:hypothetical protein C8R47DRAFT_1216891 [Mycena vitilis]